MFIFGWTTHLFLSLALSFNFLSFLGFDIESNTIIILGIMIGSLLPDCDLRDSSLAGILPLWLFSEKFAVHKGVTNEKEIRFYGHRKFTHSLLWILLMYILYLITISLSIKIFKVQTVTTIKYFFIGNVFGNILHILEDYFNKTGIKLFYPLPKFGKVRFHFKKTIKTGSFQDDIISLLSFAYCIIYIFNFK